MPNHHRTHEHKKHSAIVSKLASQAYDQMDRKRYEDAADTYLELLSMLGKNSPKWKSYKYQLCVCYKKLGDSDLTLRHCHELVKQHPKDNYLAFNLLAYGLVRVEAGEAILAELGIEDPYEEALRVFEISRDQQRQKL